MQANSNIVQPQKGLVSTMPNPTVQTGINFNNAIKPLANPTLGANYGTSVPMSGIGGVSSTNPFIASPTGGTSGTTTPFLGSPSYGSGTLGQDQNVPAGTLKSPLIPITGTLGTSTGNSGYVPVPQSSSSSTTSPYQQNLAKYGISSIPQGYSFDASGKLTNGAGQEYAPSQPSTSQPNNTSGAGGGVSATGNTQNQGSGTGGGAAPAGMMYDGQGGLVPISPTNQYNSSNPASFNGLINQTSNFASGPSQAYTDATNTYNKDKQALTTSRTNEAAGLAANASNPIPLEFQQGRGQVLQSQYAQEQAALGSQLSADSALLGNANTQQSTEQSGLLGAAGLVSPQVGSYGQTQYSPLGGTVSGSATVQPSDPFYQTLQTYAQALANNQGGAIPSSITGNPALQAQLLQMAQKINPNFNYNTSQGIASGEQQSGAAGGAINAQQQQQVATYKSASQQAGNLGLQLNQLISQTGVNPSDINAVNQGIQKIASNTSNPNYATFQNLISDLASTYAQVLTPAGGAVTDMVRTISGSLLDSSMKGSGISQVMQNLDAQVQAKISGVMTNNSPSTLNGTNNVQSNGGLYNF